MTGLDVAELRNGMKLSPHEFAALCGVYPRTVGRWEACLRSEIPPMVEATRRVFLVLRSATRIERQKWAEALRAHGWRAAWAMMFNGASGGKPVAKTTGSKTRMR